MPLLRILVTALTLFTAAHAGAASVAAGGRLDDWGDVGTMTFSLDADTADVVIWTSQYDNYNFDPTIEVWDGQGKLVAVSGDILNKPERLAGMGPLDDLLRLNLTAGTYTVTVTEWRNFPVGTTLAEGFTLDGAASPTKFNNCTGCSYQGNWNVGVAGDAVYTPSMGGAEPALPVPELPRPVQLAAGLALLAGVAGRTRRR